MALVIVASIYAHIIYHHREIKCKTSLLFSLIIHCNSEKDCCCFHSHTDILQWNVFIAAHTRHWSVLDKGAGAGPRSAVGSTSDSRARGPGFNTRTGHILLFLLPLNQEGQLSVTGESICMKY